MKIHNQPNPLETSGVLFVQLLHWCPGAETQLEHQTGWNIQSVSLNSTGIFTFYEQEDSRRTGKSFQRRREHNGALTPIEAVTAGVDVFEHEVEGAVFCPVVFHVHSVGASVALGGVSLLAPVVVNFFSILEKVELDVVGRRARAGDPHAATNRRTDKF